MRSILTTVGTSLLGNIRREMGIDRGRLPSTQQAANFLVHTDPVKASAETNSLSRLLEDGDKIVFLHSQTKEGEWCADELARYYRNSGYKVEVLEIPDLNYAESRFKMRGLRSLVATLIGVIRSERSRGRHLLINATGGFKAEIAYATLVGLLFDLPVYYIHEVFSDIVELPPAPIGWDFSLIADYEEFFEWVYEDLRPAREVDERLQRLPPEIRLLLSEEEGYTLLSPAGEAFYEAYREKVQFSESIPLFLSTSAMKSYNDYPPDIKERFDRLFKKLKVRELRIGGTRSVGNFDTFVYPGGHLAERIFYFEKDGEVYVCEIARHGENYERLIEQGVWRKDYPEDDFQEWRTMR